MRGTIRWEGEVVVRMSRCGGVVCGVLVVFVGDEKVIGQVSVRIAERKGGYWFSSIEGASRRDKSSIVCRLVLMMCAARDPHLCWQPCRMRCALVAA